MSVNRRFFLLGGSALAAHAFQSETTVGTGMIGTGNRGSFLLQGVLQQPNAKVLALCDIKPDRLDKAASAAARDNPATYADWQRVIDRQGRRCRFHCDAALSALRNGHRGDSGRQERVLRKAASESPRRRFARFSMPPRLPIRCSFPASSCESQKQLAGDRPQDSRGRDWRRDHGEGPTARRRRPAPRRHFRRLVLRRDQVRRLPH